MPFERIDVSVSQFAALIGFDEQRLVDIEVDRRSSRVTLVLEPEDGDTRQPTTPWITATAKGVK